MEELAALLLCMETASSSCCVSDGIAKEMQVVVNGAVSPNIMAYFKENPDLQTPCLVVDTSLVRTNFLQLKYAIPRAKIYYAVKSNPMEGVVRLLVQHGCCFDTASVPAGALPSQISFGNTIKKSKDIQRAYALGIRLYAFDSVAELEKLAQHAPGSNIFVRILTSGEGADWPLSRKFGCEPLMATALMVRANSLNLVPFGVSFHVGSQVWVEEQKDLRQYDVAIKTVATMFADLKAIGISLQMVNLGGGFPTRYRKDIPSIAEYGVAINASLHRHFGDEIPEVIVEPGRSMCGNAGVIMTEVVLVSKKSFATNERHWVYLDIGKFHGLAETLDEAIQYEIIPVDGYNPSTPTHPVIIAGPTCDSADVLYEKSHYELPIDLQCGDKLLVLATGSYTSTYSSVCFNGFAPLASVCL